MTLAKTEPIGVARGFFQRLLGVHGRSGRTGAIWIPGCRAVHTFWTRRPLWLVFFTRDGTVLSEYQSRWGRLYRHRDADSVLEIDLAVMPGAANEAQRGRIIAACRHICGQSLRAPLGARPRGVAMLEALIATPLVLLLGLLLVQLSLLAHGRLVVGYAAAEAARAAASGHVSEAAIESGLRRGLTPLLGVSARDADPDISTIASATLRTQIQYLRGKAEGWIRWSLLSPTQATLADWGQGVGRVVPPAQWHTGAFPAPHSGTAERERLTGLPSGLRSGQTFLDAGVIKLQVSVGLPLQVPLAGPLLARSLAWWRGCSLSDSAALGAVTLAGSWVTRGSLDGDSAGLNECRLLLAPRVLGLNEKMPARLPVRVIAVSQAQTPFSAKTLPVH
jgi:hypothetical protein